MQDFSFRGPRTSQLKIKKFPIACTPVEFFKKIHGRYEYAFLLESMKGPKKLAQFSFIGCNPRLTIIAEDENVIIQETESNEKIRIKASDPLVVIKEVLGETCHLENSRLVGGAVGYISYDAVRYWEKLPNLAKDDLQYPNIHLGVYDDCVIFDHIQGQNFYVFRGDDRTEELIGLLDKPHEENGLSFTQPKPNITKDRYEDLVQKTKAYVESGDILQAVLSKRYDFDVKGDLTTFYESLLRINPSPYMYFLKMGDKRIIGSSPEMLVRVEGNNVETFPIAGTRPRVDDPVKNQDFAKELLSDPKELAEHVMLVDLARNDIGRVSRFGSVHVPEFMKVYEYSHVQHIVSSVVGKLRNNCDCYDALRAVFPAGTVSGAPKVRAMEIIEASEPTRRGPYAGAVGYFSYNGSADFAITIRTLVADGEKCFVQAGGGIVADSNPEKEWFETEHKAKALMKALEVSEE
jgi:anthranilate synthase component 1